MHLDAREDSRITLRGSDFNFPLYEPIQPLSGTIVGKLADGNFIEWAFARDQTAHIVLVPEPSSLLLTMLGMLALLSRRRTTQAPGRRGERPGW